MNACKTCHHFTTKCTIRPSVNKLKNFPFKSTTCTKWEGKAPHLLVLYIPTPHKARDLQNIGNELRRSMTAAEVAIFGWPAAHAGSPLRVDGDSSRMVFSNAANGKHAIVSVREDGEEWPEGVTTVGGSIRCEYARKMVDTGADCVPNYGLWLAEGLK